MQSIRHGCAALAGALLLFVQATATAQNPVTVHDAWVRATVPQQQGTGAFMRLTATTDTRLVAASSPVSPIVEVHEMAIVGDVMRMREVAGIDLPAGRTVALTPGGYHIMIMNLRQPLSAGDTVPLTLTFENRAGQRETQTVTATVKALTTDGSTATGHGGHDHAGHDRGQAHGHGSHGPASGGGSGKQ